MKAKLLGCRTHFVFPVEISRVERLIRFLNHIVDHVDSRSITPKSLATCRSYPPHANVVVGPVVIRVKARHAADDLRQ